MELIIIHLLYLKFVWEMEIQTMRKKGHAMHKIHVQGLEVFFGAFMRTTKYFCGHLDKDVLGL